MNLDTLVRAGQPPWQPVPAAEDVDVWDKYDFPICGTYRLGETLVIFTLITTAGTRSLWAYVPVPHGSEKDVAEAWFDTEAEFDEFLGRCFAGHRAVFAAAEDLVITSMSDGTLIPAGKNSLLNASADWYVQRSAALQAEKAREQLATASKADDPGELLSAAQGIIERLPT